MGAGRRQNSSFVNSRNEWLNFSARRTRERDKSVHFSRVSVGIPVLVIFGRLGGELDAAPLRRSLRSDRVDTVGPEVSDVIDLRATQALRIAAADRFFHSRQLGPTRGRNRFTSA
jgi:hypothetical protein